MELVDAKSEASRQSAEAEQREASLIRRIEDLESVRDEGIEFGVRIAELVESEQLLRQRLQDSESRAEAAAAWRRQAVQAGAEASTLREQLARTRDELEALRLERLVKEQLVAPAAPFGFVAERSDRFSDLVRKTLELAKRDGKWEITREESN